MLKNSSMNATCCQKDFVRCTICNHVYQVFQLEMVRGHRIPKPGQKGENWLQFLYYCPCDANKKNREVKLYDPGDGKLVVVFGAYIELLEKDHPALLRRKVGAI